MLSTDVFIVSRALYGPGEAAQENCNRKTTNKIATGRQHTKLQQHYRYSYEQPNEVNCMIQRVDRYRLSLAGADMQYEPLNKDSTGDRSEQ